MDTLEDKAGADHTRPQGNDRYVRTAPSNPKLTRWQYDDDVSLLGDDRALTELTIQTV